MLTAEGVASLREERTAPEGDAWGYGMGWWLIPPKEGESTVYLYVDSGLYGSVSWIDVDRNYGGVVFFEEYTFREASKGSQGVVNQLIPIIEDALDEAGIH